MAESRRALVILFGDGSVAARYDVENDDVDAFAAERLLEFGNPSMSAVLVDPEDTSAVAEGQDEDGNVHTSRAYNGHAGGAPLLHRRLVRAIGHLERSEGSLRFVPAPPPQQANDAT